MKLLILRHGKAQATAERDADRQLTEQGQVQVRAQASAHRHLFADVQRVFVSPYLRAQQTFQVLDQALAGQSLPAPETVDWLTPEADVAAVCEQLQAVADQSVLLVSHQPLVSELVAYLSGDGLLSMGTASLAHLELEVPARNLGQLRAIHDVSC